MIAKVCDRESRRDSWFENRLVLLPRYQNAIKQMLKLNSAAVHVIELVQIVQVPYSFYKCFTKDLKIHALLVLNESLYKNFDGMQNQVPLTMSGSGVKFLGFLTARIITCCNIFIFPT